MLQPFSTHTPHLTLFHTHSLSLCLAYSPHLSVQYKRCLLFRKCNHWIYTFERTQYSFLGLLLTIHERVRIFVRFRFTGSPSKKASNSPWWWSENPVSESRPSSTRSSSPIFIRVRLQLSCQRPYFQSCATLLWTSCERPRPIEIYS